MISLTILSHPLAALTSTSGLNAISSTYDYTAVMALALGSPAGALVESAENTMRTTQ